jgi:hypothetical protein
MGLKLNFKNHKRALNFWNLKEKYSWYFDFLEFGNKYGTKLIFEWDKWDKLQGQVNLNMV